eukprot:m.109954 g.109954  ORF g.109954 m.109954 type:complete len:5180 (+) comp37381_c0_seq5:135-15674(+)
MASTSRQICYYTLFVLVYIVIWGFISIPTIFFYLPSDVDTTNRTDTLTLTNQVTKTYLQSVLERLVKAGRYDLAKMLGGLSQSNRTLGYDEIKAIAARFNLSGNVWMRECNDPLVPVPGTLNCTPPCVFPLLTDGQQTATDVLLAISIIVTEIAGVFTLVTWLHLPVLSTFPHIIPLYLVGESMVLALIWTLPLPMSRVDAFCDGNMSFLPGTIETKFCTFQGIGLQYLTVSMACWFFCYTLNIHLTIVHNKADLVLRNWKTHFVQSLICWGLPAVNVIVAFFVRDERGNRYHWARSDIFTCTPANDNIYYYCMVLPIQLLMGTTATLLANNVSFLKTSRESTDGMKLVHRASKQSGISSLERRLAALGITFVVVVFYDISRATYLLWSGEKLRHDVREYTFCKQIKQDCDESFRKHVYAPLTIISSVTVGVFCCAALLFLVGTPATTQLWKYWTAKVCIAFRWPKAKKKFAKWVVVPKWHRSMTKRRKGFDGEAIRLGTLRSTIRTPMSTPDVGRVLNSSALNGLSPLSMGNGGSSADNLLDTPKPRRKVSFEDDVVPLGREDSREEKLSGGVVEEKEGESQAGKEVEGDTRVNEDVTVEMPEEGHPENEEMGEEEEEKKEKEKEKEEEGYVSEDDDDLGIREEDGSSSSSESETDDRDRAAVSDGNDMDDQAGCVDEIVATVSGEDVEAVDADSEMGVATIVQNALDYFMDWLCSVCPTLDFILCLSGEGSIVFPSAHQVLTLRLDQLEHCLCDYVKNVMDSKWSAKRMLDLLTRFKSVERRPMLSSVLNDKFLQAFSAYFEDLKAVVAEYEERKNCPATMTDVPSVFAAISWSRHLFQRVETPMQILKENRNVSQYPDFAEAVKLYNKLATALVTFESLWFNEWCRQIDSCKAGLTAPLLKCTTDSQSKCLVVNADKRVLSLMSEAKLLQTLGLEVPENALAVLKMEKQFKTYHQLLKQLLLAHDMAVRTFSPAMAFILPEYSSFLLKHLQPGWLSVTWDSMNIDAYLHQATSAIAKVKTFTAEANATLTIADQLVGDIKEVPLLESGDISCQIMHCFAFEKRMQNIIKSRASAIHSMIQQIDGHLSGLISMVDTCTAHISKDLASSSSSSAAAKKRTRGMATTTRASSEIRNQYGRLVREALKGIILHSLECLWDGVSRRESGFQFAISVKNVFPALTIDPGLDDIQQSVNNVVDAVLDVAREANCLNCDEEDIVETDASVRRLCENLKSSIVLLTPKVTEQLDALCQHDFLWKEDIRKSFLDFVQSNPDHGKSIAQITKYQDLENKVLAVPSEIAVDCLCLHTESIKNFLFALAVFWKNKYSWFLHQGAKRMLDEAMTDSASISADLATEIESLSCLKTSLHFADQIIEADETIDVKFVPVEHLYSLLRDFDVFLSREEVEQVSNLRTSWNELVSSAQHVRHQLMVDQRRSFERQLDKEVKEFLVKVIQLRNSFDAEGPSVPGIKPSEALSRLHAFQTRYDLFVEKRDVFCGVQKLFGMSITPYPELDKTGEELELLGMLYQLYQKFLVFDSRFKESLWSEVDLDGCVSEVDQLWKSCVEMPERLQAWPAYLEMKAAMCYYLNIFPLLKMLASDDIKNRHWVEVMETTGKVFQLEAHYFRMSHLLDAGLVEHKKAVMKICEKASAECRLEERVKQIEEEWTEQVLYFVPYKARGAVMLSADQTQHLIDLLEDVQLCLATMLTLPHVAPVRDTASRWASKLSVISAILEKWLAVQSLWACLETIFSQSSVAKELSHETKKFQIIDKQWVKLMRKSYETRTVFQCCLGGDMPKLTLLDHLMEDLESCQVSLSAYLEAKRRIFFRFCFLCDNDLLSLLTHLNSSLPITRCLRILFKNVVALHTVNTEAIQGRTRSAISAELSTWNRSVSPSQSTTTKNLKDQKSISNIGSPVTETVPTVAICKIESAEGEVVELASSVFMAGGVEEWLLQLVGEIQKTLHKDLCAAVKETEKLLVDEYMYQHPGQISYLALQYCWTKQCENAICSSRYDRKAMTTLRQKFTAGINRLPGLLVKGTWRSGDCIADHRMKIQQVLTIGLHLRDCLDELVKRKLRDLVDFDWRKHCRLYARNLENSTETKFEVSLLDSNWTYDFEYYGLAPVLTIAPTTERCLLSLSQAVRYCEPVVLSGEAAAGKTTTIMGLAQLFGKYCHILSCTELLQPNVLSLVLEGSILGGLWVCLDDFHKLACGAVSVVLENLQALQGAVKAASDVCFVRNKELKINQNLGIFATSRSNAFQRPLQRMPPYLHAVFRSVGLIQPDVSILVRTWMTCEGFRAPNMLADRLVTTVNLCRDQLPGCTEGQFSLFQLHSIIKLAGHRRMRQEQSLSKDHSVGKTTSSAEMRSPSLSSIRGAGTGTASRMQSSMGTSGGAFALGRGGAGAQAVTARRANILSLQAKQDHALFGDVVKEILGSRLNSHDKLTFFNILRDVWYNQIVEIESISKSEQVEMDAIQLAVQQETLTQGFQPHQPWIDKILQLYTLLENSQGVIITGLSGSGKTAAIHTLARALTAHSAKKETPSSSSSSTVYKLHYINPVAMNNLSDLFGRACTKSSAVWQDGVFTSLIKKACKMNNTQTWLCLDSPGSSTWTSCVEHVFSNEKILTLGDGSQVPVPASVKLLLELTDLQHVSPSLLMRAALIYFDVSTLGWRPQADAWLTSRSSQEQKVIEPLIVNLVDSVSYFIQNECSSMVKVCETGMFQTCLSYLTSLLDCYAETREIFDELHVERLFVFSLVWSFGGLLDGNDSVKFSNLLKKLTKCFPDDDPSSSVSVYDYFVDESGEFDSWQVRPQRMSPIDIDPFGDIFVDNFESSRIAFLVDLAHMSKRNVLLLGPPGVGKTAILNQFLKEKYSHSTVKKLALCPATSMDQIFDFLDVNMYHRQGFTYGPRYGASMELFIDDLNLADVDIDGNQPIHEALRQIIDHRGYYNRSKLGGWKHLEDVQFLAAAQLKGSDVPGVAEKLRRHFTLIYCPRISEDSLRFTIYSGLEGYMLQNDSVGFPTDLHDHIVDASLSLLTLADKVLQPSELSGRSYYYFSVQDVLRIFQGLQWCEDDMLFDPASVATLWRHESRQVFLNRISRETDYKWTEKTIDSLTQKHFPNVSITEESQFVTFSQEVHGFHPRKGAVCSGGHRPVFQQIDTDVDLQSSVNGYAERYREEIRSGGLNSTLSELEVSEVVKIQRTLCHRGNIVVVGRHGLNLTGLCKLALYISGFQVLSDGVDGQLATFHERLRTAYRLAGCDGKGCSIILKEKDLDNPSIMEIVYAVTVTGEFPTLFSNDELEGFLHALRPAIKKDFPNNVIDPLQYFKARIQHNMRLIVCLTPDYFLVKDHAHLYPGVVGRCHILFVQDWKPKAVSASASTLLKKQPWFEEEPISIRNLLTATMAAIHCEVISHTKQLPWAKPSKPARPPPSAGRSSRLASEKVADENVPSPKSTLNDRLEELDSRKTDPERIFIGPKTLERFVHCFHAIYQEKRAEVAGVLQQLCLALSALEDGVKHAEQLRKTVDTLTVQHRELSQKAADLLVVMSSLAASLEQLKSNLGTGGRFLKALSAAHESEIRELPLEEDSEMEDDLASAAEEGYDRRHQRLLGAIAEVEKCLEPLAEELVKCREEAISFRGKMDRNTVERIRTLVNPPRLVGTIMELMMAVIRQTQATSDPHEPSPGSVLSEGSANGTPAKTQSSSRKRPSASTFLSNDGTQGRLDKDQWTSIQSQIGDPQKFVEAIQNVPWQEGLTTDLASLIETYLGNPSKSIDVSSELKASRKAKKGSAGSSLLNVITLAAAKHASEDAAILTAYIKALLRYHNVYVPHKSNEIQLEDLHKEVERLQQEIQDKKPVPSKGETSADASGKESEAEQQLSGSDIPRLQEQLIQLQAEFEEAATQKYKVDLQRKSAVEVLKHGERALELLENLKAEWHGRVEYLEEHSGLITNCLLAAAFIAYCSPLQAAARTRMIGLLLTVVSKQMEIPDKLLFRSISLLEFMHSQTPTLFPKLTRNLQRQCLPTDYVSFQNGWLASQQYCSAWPVLIDPHGFAEQWLKNCMPQVVVISSGDSQLKHCLEAALSQGSALLVTSVDPEGVLEDPLFQNVVRCKEAMKTGSLKKVLVLDKEIDCNPGFCLYFITCKDAWTFSPSVLACFHVIDFCPLVDGLQQLLLNRFVFLEKSRLHDERKKIDTEIVYLLDQTEQLEQSLLSCLTSTDSRGMLGNLTVTKDLISLKESYNDAMESLALTLDAERVTIRQMEMLSDVGSRGAILFNSIRCFGFLDHLYSMSWRHFLRIFDIAVSGTNRFANKSVIEKLTSYVFAYAIQGIREKDRLTFSTFVAIEIERTEGNVSVVERQFLLDPLGMASRVFTSIMNGSPLPEGVTSTNQSAFSKKPYEWMTEDHWQRIQSLAFVFDWFSEPVEKILREGRENQWKSLCESDQLMSLTLPENLDQKMTHLQRLLVLKTIRHKKSLSLLRAFAESILGKEFKESGALDIHQTYLKSTASTPILLFYNEEPGISVRVISKLAKRKQAKLETLVVSSENGLQRHEILSLVQKGMSQGFWVYVECVYPTQSLLAAIDSLFRQSSEANSSFRLWLSMSSESLTSSRFLDNCFKIMTDSPQSLVPAVLTCLDLIEPDTLNWSPRSEWGPLLHNLCLMHCSLMVRSKMKRNGLKWSCNWNSQHFMDALRYVRQEFAMADKVDPSWGSTGAKGLSWAGLRHHVTQLVYGSQVLDPNDYVIISAVVDHWLAPSSIKKEWDMFKSKYRLPACAFSFPLRVTSIAQWVQNSNLTNCSELCGPLQTLEFDALTGRESYDVLARVFIVFERLLLTVHPAMLEDTFPPLLKTKRSPTPTIARRFSSPAKLITPGEKERPIKIGLERAPSFVLTLSSFLKPAKAEFPAVVNSLWQKLFKGWNKEYISERMKKFGISTPFCLWIKGEIEKMQNGLNQVRDDLQSLKDVLGGSCSVLSSSCLLVAKSLQQGQVPAAWHALFPQNLSNKWTPVSFISDVTQCCQHFDRALGLGRDKVPGYWLGAFANPRGLLSTFVQDGFRDYEKKFSVVEQFVCTCEITSRDKEHLRDAPVDGLYAFGLHLWGAAWDKAAVEVNDSAPRPSIQSLPIVHITAAPASDKTSVVDPVKQASTFACPCYATLASQDAPVIYLDVRHDDIPHSRWPFRGVVCTLRPF